MAKEEGEIEEMKKSKMNENWVLKNLNEKKNKKIKKQKWLIDETPIFVLITPLLSL